MSNEEKKVSINIMAIIAIMLWLVSTVFQIGAIYATSNITTATGDMRNYVDKGDKELRKIMDDKFDKILDKLDELKKEKSK